MVYQVFKDWQNDAASCDVRRYFSGGGRCYAHDDNDAPCRQNSKNVKSEKDFKLTHKQKLWGLKFIQIHKLKDRKQPDLPESFQLNAEVSRQTWFGCSFGQSKTSAEQEDQLPRHFSFDYFPVNQALWKQKNRIIKFKNNYELLFRYLLEDMWSAQFSYFHFSTKINDESISGLLSYRIGF